MGGKVSSVPLPPAAGGGGDGDSDGDDGDDNNNSDDDDDDDDGSSEGDPEVMHNAQQLVADALIKAQVSRSPPPRSPHLPHPCCDTPRSITWQCVA